VVFDTDIGTNVDDALALALALASQEIQLLGVVVGNGDRGLLETRARIAARLLGLAGRADIPVLIGHPGRLSPSDRYTNHGDEGEGLLDTPVDVADARILDVPGADWLIAQSRRERIHVVATGPLTTLAVAMQRDVELAARLDHLTVMGGMAQDYNTACDPAAALTCAESGVDITWVTIDITLRTAMTRRALDALAAQRTPFCDALARLTTTWSRRHFRPREDAPPDAVAYYHDPLAMSAVFAGRWLSLRRERLRYSVDDGVFRAMPAADSDGPAHDALVSVEVDPNAFEDEWLARVVGSFGGSDTRKS
jgi:inosine-uridine nucleoside N-ribohydrolase